MLTLMLECALSKSGTSFFRSAIEGLSTDPSVMVVAPPPPPPPPAPGEQAAPSSAMNSPRIVIGLCRYVRNFLSLMQSHLFSFGQIGMPQAPDNVVKRQRCQI